MKFNVLFASLFEQNPQHCFAWCITCQILKILVYFDWHSLTRNKRINELSSVYHPMLLLDGIKWVPVGWLHCDVNPGYFHRFLSPIAMLICSFCAEFVKQLWNIINISVVVVPQRQFRWFFSGPTSTSHQAYFRVSTWQRTAVYYLFLISTAASIRSRRTSTMAHGKYKAHLAHKKQWNKCNNAVVPHNVHVYIVKRFNNTIIHTTYLVHSHIRGVCV